MIYLNLAAIRECTESEGPGKRFALWCQGCLKKCKNCCNLHMQPLTENKVVKAGDITTLIKHSKEKYAIEGVSFIGGEPFLQAKSLIPIAEWCHINDLSVLSFSGYLFDELKDDIIDGSRDLVSLLDILIDGEYREDELETERLWAGSRNQHIYFLSSRYRQGIEFGLNANRPVENSIEYNVYENLVQVNGWPFDVFNELEYSRNK
jgi:anaerobic ribonucleoside-triphosphate reductase activating protein